MAALMQDVDPNGNHVVVTAIVPNNTNSNALLDNESNQELVEHAENGGDADNFKDLLCIILSAMFCCPLCPILPGISLYYHQKATELYWTGHYTESSLKQSVSVKFVIGQCVVSPILLIIAFFM